MVPDILSPSNDRIKWLVRLRDRRHRDAEGVFVVEGEQLYRRALDAGQEPLITFVTANTTVETTGPTVSASPDAMDKASYRPRSQEVIAVFSQLDTRLAALEVGNPPLILVAENIEKPGNLGAMLRTVGAAGADALIAVGETVDAHNPNVVRASTGALFTVPLALTDWDSLEPWLDEKGILVVSASPDATEAVWETPLAGPLAIVVGAEDEGLSDRARAVSDISVRIPQNTGSVDSLNVSVAAAVLLFEARRQRAH